MRRVLTLALVAGLFCLPAPAGAAGDGLDFAVSARARKMSGYAKYRMTISGWYDYSGDLVLINLASELEFPLDVYMTDATFTMSGTFMKERRWALGVTIGANMQDPRGRMKDSDWLQIPEYGFDHKIIYSESDAALKAANLDIFGGIGLWPQSSVRLDVLIGYRRQKLTYDIFGLDGWSLDENLNPIAFSAFAGEQVLAYQVTYSMPYLGIAPAVDIMPSLRADGNISFSPRAASRDHDDHILRRKELDGRCTGTMFSADGGLAYTIGGPTGKLCWVIGLGYEYMYISASGTETQRWYGDDPSAEGDETGTTISGLRHKVTSRQNGIRLNLTCRF